MLLLTKVPFGGGTSSTFATNSEELQTVKLVMAPLFYFGWMSGMIFFCKSNFQDFSPLQKNQKISVADFLSVTDLASHFHLPLSEQAYEEYQELQEIVQNIQVTQEDKRTMAIHMGTSKICSQKNIVNISTKKYNPQSLSYGFGVPHAATN